MFLNPPDYVIYCHGTGTVQPKLVNLAASDSKIRLHEGFSSSVYENHDPSSHLFLVIDDLMSSDCYKDLSDLFTKGTAKVG